MNASSFKELLTLRPKVWTLCWEEYIQEQKRKVEEVSLSSTFSIKFAGGGNTIRI